MAEAAASTPKVQIYPPKTDTVSPFWREKYEKDAKKYWDLFYKRNTDKFFKDRHYLQREWGHELRPLDVTNRTSERRVVLEVGCGVGNTVFPLLAEDPELFVYACDFAPRAVDLVKAHAEYDESRVKAFVCDITNDFLSDNVPNASVDAVTMVFVLSAISPEKMPEVLQNVRKVLKPGGVVLLRDYAAGDLAQERLTGKEQKISDHFYVRGDGTRVYYFTEDALRTLFEEEGFECRAMKVHCRQVENRAREITMNRRWIQGTFSLPSKSTSSLDTLHLADPQQAAGLAGGSGSSRGTCPEESSKPQEEEDLIVGNIFAMPVQYKVQKIQLGCQTVHLRCLPEDHQHTEPSTGLLIWDSARLLGAYLAADHSLVKGKSVLELGAGSCALPSLACLSVAKSVVATDGDARSMELLQANLALNSGAQDMHHRRVRWGHSGDIDEVMKLSLEACGELGFDCILGADVVYVREAMPLLFSTARKLCKSNSTLLLCYITRRVCEVDIVATAKAEGFEGDVVSMQELVDKCDSIDVQALGLRTPLSLVRLMRLKPLLT